MSRKPVTAAQQETEFDSILKKAASKEETAQRLVEAGAGIRALAEEAQRLEVMIPDLIRFAKEREDLGEYDAGAAAIIEMAKTQLDLARAIAALMRAHMHLELDR